MCNKNDFFSRIIAFKLTDAEHIKYFKLFDFSVYLLTYASIIISSHSHGSVWCVVIHECVANPTDIFYFLLYMKSSTRKLNIYRTGIKSCPNNVILSDWFILYSCQSFDFIGLFLKRARLFIFCSPKC